MKPMGCRVLVLALATLCLLSPRSGLSASVQPAELRCEYRSNPEGLDVAQPRLSWRWTGVSRQARDLRQTAYHLLVATSPTKLRPGEADLWDSGVVASDASVLVPYGGRALRAGTDCYWIVRGQFTDGLWSPWSEPARWSMGPLSEADWTADWIGTGESFVRGPGGGENPERMPADPWFRKTFATGDRPIRVRAHVASVGYHELWINGRKAGDAVLQPSVTDHSKRARYNSYDLTGALHSGTNVVGLWLGTGWSIFPKFETPDKPRAPIVRAQLELTYADGRVERLGTDATWETRASPSTLLGVWDFTNFGGERYQAAKEVADWSASTHESGWAPVKVFRPNLAMSADPVEPNRLQDELRPVGLSEPQAGVHRFDLGQNFAGFVELKVRGQRPGDRIELQFSEQEKRPMTHRLRNVFEVGPSGEGVFRNRFNYGIGRWVTVTGLRERPRLDDLRGWLVRTDYREASAFECSNEPFNRIHAMSLWTYENLSLGGYLVDCPHRERMGYGGDAHASTTMGLMNFDTGALYTKWAEDWRDAQGRSSSWGPGNSAASASEPGSLPYTAPTYWGGGGPGWCGFVVHLPAELWRVNGDRRLIEQMMPTIERWLAFLETKQRDDLLRRWGGEWDFLGDWLWPGATGVNGDTRETLCFNNCYWIYNLQTASRLAAILGRSDQAQAWSQRAEHVRRRVHREFYNPADASYVDGSQAYLALALVANVPPAELRAAVEKRFVEEIQVRRGGHIHAGITGGAFVFKALREMGRDDLLASMVAQPDYPGWADMIRQGATTFWESWENNPDLSYLHSSYLYVGAWFVEGVLGIQPRADVGGFARFDLRPAPLDRADLSWARGHFDSVRGRIESSWARRSGGIEMEFTVPANTVASIHLPAGEAGQVTEAGRSLERSPGLRVRGVEAGRLVVEAGSGRYRFRVSAPPN